MICPSCGHENIQGADECDNCGADLRTADIPRPSSGFEELLVARPLATLAGGPPLTAAPDTPAAEAVRQMQAAAVGCLVVDDGERVRGIITERDLLLRATDLDLAEVSVGELMTADPVVLRPDDSIAVAIHKMAVGGFRHIPLVENGHATAVVSARDVFRYILDIID